MYVCMYVINLFTPNLVQLLECHYQKTSSSPLQPESLVFVPVLFIPSSTSPHFPSKFYQSSKGHLYFTLFMKPKLVTPAQYSF